MYVYKRTFSDIIISLSSRGLVPFISDKTYLKLYYKKMTGRTLDLENPRYYNEKIQWLKLYDHRPEYNIMVDKFLVKEFASNKIGYHHIIPTLGVWNHFDEIEFDKLPNSFVIKCTHDSGSVIIVKEKNNMDKKAIRNKIEKCLKRNYYRLGREWAYKDIKPRIIIEKLMINGYEDELKDYKIFNFDGKPTLIQVDFDRFKNHHRNLYTPEWEYINGTICYPSDKNKIIEKPKELSEMLYLASKLSKGYPHIRTDFYIVNGHIFFGELTLYHGSGVEKISPEELEIKMGNEIILTRN